MLPQQDVNPWLFIKPPILSNHDSITFYNNYYHTLHQSVTLRIWSILTGITIKSKLQPHVHDPYPPLTYPILEVMNLWPCDHDHFLSGCHMATGSRREDVIWFQWVSSAPDTCEPTIIWPMETFLPSAPHSITLRRSWTVCREKEQGLNHQCGTVKRG